MLERSPLTPVFSFTHFYSRMFVNITSLNLFSYAMLDSPHYNSACLYKLGKTKEKTSLHENILQIELLEWPNNGPDDRLNNCCVQGLSRFWN